MKKKQKSLKTALIELGYSVNAIRDSNKSNYYLSLRNRYICSVKTVNYQQFEINYLQYEKTEIVNSIFQLMRKLQEIKSCYEIR